MWFAHGMPIKGVDSYFSLHPAGRLFESLSSWDARTSSGTPSSDVIAAGLNWLQAALSLSGLPLPAVEMIITLTLSITAAIGMYHFGLLILDGQLTRPVDRWVSCALAISWLANPFALSYVWAHQLLIQVTWAALPWLLFAVVCCVTSRIDVLNSICLLLTIMIIAAAAFPHAYLPGIGLVMSAVGIGSLGLADSIGRAFPRLLVAGLALAGGTLWWLLPSLPMLNTLVAQATIGPDSPHAQLEYASQFSPLGNVLSLTAVPILHQYVDKTPYLAWSSLVLVPPGNALVFVLPIIAAVGGIYTLMQPRLRMLGMATLSCFLVGLFFSKGANQPWPDINEAMLSLPLGDAVRHPIDKFSFDVVLPMCLLFACGLAWLSRRRLSSPLAVAASVVVCVYLAVPWWSGSVVPVGGGRLPSAFVDVPPSYDAVGSDLAGMPHLGKTMVLPYSRDGASAFAWKSGIQPNLDCLLQDWAPERSLLCRDTGEALADRVPEALLQATTSRDIRAFDLAYLSGIDSWLVHNDWDSSYFKPAISPANAMTFLMQPRSTETAPQPVHRQGQLIRLPSTGVPLTFFVRVDAAPVESDKLLQIGSAVVQVNRASSPSSVYLGIRDVPNHFWFPADGAVFPTGEWHVVTLSSESNRLSLAVDGIEATQLLVCDTSCHPVPGRGLPLPNSSQNARIISASASDGTKMTFPSEVHGISKRTFGASRVSLIRATSELALFRQPSLPAVYAAQSLRAAGQLDTAGELLSAAHAAVAAPYPAIVSSDAPVQSVDSKSETTWIRDSSVQLHGTLTSKGPNALLVFLETYDPHWVLTIDGSRVDRSRHEVANGFANAWFVSGIGTFKWTIDYDLQPAVSTGAAIGGALLVFALCVPIGRYIASVPAMRRKRFTINRG